MSDFPSAQDMNGSIIGVFSPESITDISNLGLNIAIDASAAAWPAANLAIYIPFRVAGIAIATKIFWYNGATVGTNSVDVGIYDAQGNKLVSSGSTLTAGVSSLQSADITDTTLRRGLYFMAMAVNGTTDTFSRASSVDVRHLRGVAMYQQATAFNLPTTAVFAAVTNAYLPHVFITQQVTI